MALQWKIKFAPRKFQKHHNGSILAGLKNLGGNNFETNGDDFKIFGSTKQTAQETYQLVLLVASP